MNQNHILDVKLKLESKLYWIFSDFDLLILNLDCSGN